MTTLDVWTSPPMLAVWAALGALLGTLLLLAASLWAGDQALRQARSLWGRVRGQRAQVIAAVNEPTDPLIVQLARLTTIPAPVWAALLPALLESLIAGLDRALRESAPADPTPDA